MATSENVLKRFWRHLGETPERHKDLTFYPNATNGPYTTDADEHRLTVTGRDGSALTIDAYLYVDRRPNREQLHDGVAIWLDGALIGHLVQTTRGFSRKARAVHIRPLDGSAVLPHGHYFRLRGNYSVSLESPDGTVLREGSALWSTIKLRTNKTSNPALIALQVAVRTGFNPPLGLSPVWKPKEH